MLNPNKHTKTKPKDKPTFSFNNSAHMCVCVYHCVHNCRT